MAEALKKNWNPESHEFAVEDMYATNALHATEMHQGYLNFGLWEDGIEDYLSAAENMVHTLGKGLGLKQGSRLLDVACGMGTQDLYLSRKFGPLEIDAIDVTWAHVSAGKKRARGLGLEKSLRFHHGTAVRLPFTDESFTHALSIEGPVHFNTRESFFAEAFRVLRPGGKLALADYVLKRLPRNRLEKAILEATVALWKIPQANICTSLGYARNLRRKGFEEVRIREAGALTFPGYYREQKSWRYRLSEIRAKGFKTGGLGFVIDIAAYQAYRLGLIDYVLVVASKAGARSP